MKRFMLGILAVLAVTSLVACGNKQEENQVPETNNEIVETQPQEEVEIVDVPKSEQTGTAGSSIPLKDNEEEVKRLIEIAMRDYYINNYGSEVEDMRIDVEKIYSTEEEQQNETLKSYNLGPNEVAFEVRYDLKPEEDLENVMKFTAGTGTYDEETIEKFNKVIEFFSKSISMFFAMKFAIIITRIKL